MTFTIECQLPSGTDSTITRSDCERWVRVLKRKRPLACQMRSSSKWQAAPIFAFSSWARSGDGRVNGSSAAWPSTLPCGIPTLVVRSAVPFEAWASGERPLKIFAAFDFTGTSEAALRWIKGLLAAGPCELVVGYVDWPLGEVRRFGIRGEFLLGHNPPQVQQILERELAERTGALLG